MAQRADVLETITHLEYLRRLAGISQENLAAEMRRRFGGKWTTQTIGAWCRAENPREPGWTEMSQLAEILNEHLEERGSVERLSVPPFHVDLGVMTIQESSRWFTQTRPDLRLVSAN